MPVKHAMPGLGIIIALSGTLLAACGSNKSKDHKGATANPVASQLPVDIIIAEERALNGEEAMPGTVVAYREVSIVSEVSQKIARVAFADGSYVKAGQLLYKLNDADIQARLKQLAAELDLAKLNEQRLTALLKTETIKQQEYDEAASRLDVLEAQQELLRADLAKTTITAPFSGKIGISRLITGAYVTPGKELVSLQDQEQIKINFSVPEKYLYLIKAGSIIRFSSGQGQEKRRARIVATEPGISADDRSMLVQALAPNPGNRLQPGLSAKIFFPTVDMDTKGIAIPTEALLPGDNGYAVYVLKEGRAKITPVAIGNRTEAQASIVSGLRHGDSVVISNTLRLGDGVPVRAILSK